MEGRGASPPIDVLSVAVVIDVDYDDDGQGTAPLAGDEDPATSPVFISLNSNLWFSRGTDYKIQLRV